MNIKIGHGYDVHKLVKGRRLILGGVDIEHSLGLLGHSDADVLCHAVADSLLGAAGKNGYQIGNIDATVIAQSPKLAPHIDKMKENIANALEIEKENVNIKATTEEKLGFTGRCEGISAHSVCLIYKI